MMIERRFQLLASGLRHAASGRRRHKNGRKKGSIVPASAQVLPGDDPCVSLGHTGLSWCEEVERVRWGVRRSQMVEAVCLECDRPQREVRVVYPADRVITVGRGDEMTGADR